MGFIIVVWYGWLVLIALDARRLAPLARAGNSERRWRPADRGGTLRRLADVPGKFTRSAGDPHSRRASATRHQHRSLRDCAPPHVCGHKPLPDRHAFAARILARLARFAIDPRRIDAAHFHRGGCPAQWPCTAFAIGSFRAFGEVDKGASEADRCYSGSNIDSTVHQLVALPRAMASKSFTAFAQQIFDVAKAEREPEIEPDRLVNDLRREPISGVADFRHALWLRRRRDNASETSPCRRSGCPCEEHGLPVGHATFAWSTG